MVTNSSVLAWRIPWTGAWWTTVHGLQSQTQLSTCLTHAHLYIYVHTHTYIYYIYIYEIEYGSAIKK